MSIVELGVANKESTPKRRSIPVFRITGFDKADGYAVTEQEVLREKLQELGLYSENYGYSAFNPDLLDMVKRTGTFHRQDHPRANNIDCCLVMQDGEIKHTDDNDIVLYMSTATKDQSKIGAFAIYDLSKLQGRPMEAVEPDGERYVDIYYEFKEPDKKKEAVVAIVIIKDFRL